MENTTELNCLGEFEQRKDLNQILKYVFGFVLFVCFNIFVEKKAGQSLWLKIFFDHVFQNVTCHVMVVAVVIHQKIVKVAKTDGKSRKKTDVSIKTNARRTIFVNLTNIV